MAKDDGSWTKLDDLAFQIYLKREGGNPQSSAGQSLPRVCYISAKTFLAFKQRYEKQGDEALGSDDAPKKKPLNLVGMSVRPGKPGH